VPLECRTTITGTDIKPHYGNYKPRKIFKFQKSDWDEIKSDCVLTSGQITNAEQISSDTNDTLWNIFKPGIYDTTEANVPSKMSSKKHSLPWINKTLRKSVKKKC